MATGKIPNACQLSPADPRGVEVLCKSAGLGLAEIRCTVRTPLFNYSYAGPPSARANHLLASYVQVHVE